MRAPMQWLRTYCDPPLTTAAVAAALNDAGTELERIERVGVGASDHFVVGRVLSAERHPNADRLSVCTVDDGAGEPRTIVCGAPNVAAGQTVAVARPGAVMPDGTRLGEAKLRGVRSSGMILAEDEIGIGTDHSGIMVLDNDIAPGTALAERVQIRDDVLDLAISPNRPDCLAVYGIARELHALTGAPLADSPAARDAEPRGDDSAEDHATVEIADPDICLRFTARVFEDVKVGPSPLWLKARLMAAGQRPISNVVDITNYVMLLFGQPLHAFDLDRVRGGRIVVRRAREGERMLTLDGVERTLDPEIAVVADAEGPSGIAGVMGGEISEVSDATTRVLMEAATWVGPNILRTSSRLALRSEASSRFEKQLHPDQAIAAQRIAARLMVELTGARLVPGTIDAYPEPRPPRTVTMRPARVAAVLGKAVPEGEIVTILERLGFTVEASGAETLEVSVPSFRDGDVTREVDLIEEVARIHGLDQLPATLPARRGAVGRLAGPLRLRRRLEDVLRDAGLSEAITYSFVAPDTHARLRVEGPDPLTIANPLSEGQSVMRRLLLPGLLEAVRRNATHGRPQVALFESAHVYEPPLADEQHGVTSPAGAHPVSEPHHIAAVIAGTAGSWRRPPAPPDFYAAKGVAEALLRAARVAVRFEPSGEPFLHPGRQARMLAGERELGFVGELHPEIAADWELGPVACFELDADAIAAAVPGPAGFLDVASYPAVLQDIAVVVGEGVAAAEVEAAVRSGGRPLLDSVTLFDVFHGEQVGAGKKSLALRLEFRSPERTLTDEDVAAAREQIETALAAIGGSLRA